MHRSLHDVVLVVRSALGLHVDVLEAEQLMITFKHVVQSVVDEDQVAGRWFVLKFERRQSLTTRSSTTRHD